MDDNFNDEIINLMGDLHLNQAEIVAGLALDLLKES
jgi:hypothetical protein